MRSPLLTLTWVFSFHGPYLVLVKLFNPESTRVMDPSLFLSVSVSKTIFKIFSPRWTSWTTSLDPQFFMVWRFGDLVCWSWTGP